MPSKFTNLQLALKMKCHLKSNFEKSILLIVVGLGYSMNKNSVINIQYKFTIFGIELTTENKSYSNNMAFHL
jgi:hypothetical protein